MQPDICPPPSGAWPIAKEGAELASNLPRAKPRRGPEVLFVVIQTQRQANGGVNSLIEILRRLERVRPVVITQRESALTNRLRATGCQVHVWPMPWPRPAVQRRLRERLSADVPQVARWNARLARFLAKRHIQVVHFNDPWGALSMSVGAKLAGARIVLNIRDTLFHSTVRWKALRALSDRVVVLSREMQSQIEARLAWPPWMPGQSTPVSFIYSIVDPAQFQALPTGQRLQLRQTLGLTRGEIAVGVPGALVPKKQQRELLAFLRRHPQALPANTRLYFLGDCEPDKDNYSRQCYDLANSPELEGRVWLAGYHADIHRWYQALDCCLLASQYEGLARSMIECLACGTPVVAFDFCSARELLEDHDCGRVAAQGDFNQLFTQLSELACSANLRRRLGDNGTNLVRRICAPGPVAQAYEDLYLELARPAESARRNQPS